MGDLFVYFATREPDWIVLITLNLITIVCLFFFVCIFITDDAGQNFLWFIIGACIGLVIAGIGLGCWWKVETFELCQKGKK